MESRFLLNVVIGEGTTILKLFTSENQTLLVGWDSLLVLDLGLDVVDGIGRLNLEGDSLTSKSLDDYDDVSKLWRSAMAMVFNLQICIPPRRRRTRWRVDSFWML